MIRIHQLGQIFNCYPKSLDVVDEAMVLGSQSVRKYHATVDNGDDDGVTVSQDAGDAT